ncbi:MAG: metalloregulator ArsR/SmtB family transcription factor [Anaerolineales bacterium]|nr:metalloregulator ArsR/SmtB family transcription factor [Anaerolineales bacterium]
MLSALETPSIFSLLANDLRWQLVSALAQSDFNVQELQARLQSSQNLVSYHLRQLKEGRLVKEIQSIADGRETYYSLDLSRLQALFFAAGEGLHPALSPDAGADDPPAGGRRTRVLFLCTHNSARSQMAEGLLRAQAGDWIEVFSAGTHPSRVHPLAIQAMDQLGIDIREQTSKTVEQFLKQPFDYVITVCDRAKESCPIFPGAPEQIHWSFPDPTEVEGGEEAQAAAFHETALGLSQRINHLLMVMRRKAG